MTTHLLHTLCSLSHECGKTANPMHATLKLPVGHQLPHWLVNGMEWMCWLCSSFIALHHSPMLQVCRELQTCWCCIVHAGGICFLNAFTCKWKAGFGSSAHHFLWYMFQHVTYFLFSCPQEAWDLRTSPEDCYPMRESQLTIAVICSLSDRHAPCAPRLPILIRPQLRSFLCWMATYSSKLVCYLTSLLSLAPCAANLVASMHWM